MVFFFFLRTSKLLENSFIKPFFILSSNSCTKDKISSDSLSSLLFFSIFFAAFSIFSIFSESFLLSNSILLLVIFKSYLALTPISRTLLTNSFPLSKVSSKKSFFVIEYSPLLMFSFTFCQNVCCFSTYLLDDSSISLHIT